MDRAVPVVGAAVVVAVRAAVEADSAGVAAVALVAADPASSVEETPELGAIT